MRRVVRRVEAADDVIADDEVVQRSVSRAPWSPAQIVSIGVGALLAIIGGVALARTGINFEHLTDTHVVVAGLHHTALSGLIELVLGLVLIGAGTIPGAGRSSMTFLGVVLLGFGIIVAIQPSSFHSSMGMHASNGVLYIVLGSVLMIAAMVSPVIYDGGRTATRRTYVS